MNQYDDEHDEYDIRRRSLRWFGVGFWVISSCALMATIAVVLALIIRNPNRSIRPVRPPDPRDIDYHDFLSESFELHGVLHIQNPWIHADFDKMGFLEPGQAASAHRLVHEIYDRATDELEESKITKRRFFAEKYATDTLTWKPEFTRRFPERDDVFAEIEAAGHRKGTDQISQTAQRFLDLRDYMTKSGDERRIEMLRRLVPEHIQEARLMVRNMQSVRDLRRRVRGD